MRKLYHDYSAGSEPGVSLRNAQLELIGDPELRHPHFWAGFQLVGGRV